MQRLVGILNFKATSTEHVRTLADRCRTIGWHIRSALPPKCVRDHSLVFFGEFQCVNSGAAALHRGALDAKVYRGPMSLNLNYSLVRPSRISATSLHRMRAPVMLARPDRPLDPM